MTFRPHAAIDAALLVLAVVLRLKGAEPLEMDLVQKARLPRQPGKWGR